ncbi:DNA/RNA-binding protein KIN17 [Vespula squamosa]|uniref:DNA/RNA-binding protein KIN17 n=1 Tax=Vespula squamosa TaxID=30214 RepID=A0ABD2B9W4_VESSQ
MDRNDQEKLMKCIEKQIEKIFVISPSISRQNKISIKYSSFTEGTQNIQTSNSSSEKHNISEEGWLREKLLVKVIIKSLGDKYKTKDIVKLVENFGFITKVKFTTPKEVKRHLIKLYQEYLKTEKYKGKKGIVKKLHIEEYNIDVQLEEKLWEDDSTVR